jgi:hypothetical protein
MAAIRRPLSVLYALLACAAATLLHHAHNAAYLDQYPHMPAWLSPLGVVAAWLAASAVGATGYWLLVRGWRLAGLGLLFAYGCYCLDGLVHYALAPAAAHTLAMNVTIWLEAAAASALLSVLFRRRTE